MRDAASSTFLTEVAATLKDLQTLCEHDFSAFLQSSAVPATNVPANVQVRSGSTMGQPGIGGSHGYCISLCLHAIPLLRSLLSFIAGSAVTIACWTAACMIMFAIATVHGAVQMGCPAVLCNVQACHVCSVLQEQLVLHIQQSEAKDLKTFLRSTLQQQAGISASSKRPGKHT